MKKNKWKKNVLRVKERIIRLGIIFFCITIIISGFLTGCVLREVIFSNPFGKITIKTEARDTPVVIHLQKAAREKKREALIMPEEILKSLETIPDSIKRDREFCREDDRLQKESFENMCQWLNSNKKVSSETDQVWYKIWNEWIKEGATSDLPSERALKLREKIEDEKVEEQLRKYPYYYLSQAMIQMVVFDPRGKMDTKAFTYLYEGLDQFPDHFNLLNWLSILLGDLNGERVRAAKYAENSLQTITKAAKVSGKFTKLKVALINNIAYWLADEEKRERQARGYMEQLKKYIHDNPSLEDRYHYLDTIGLVKLRFSDYKKDVEESMDKFKDAMNDAMTNEAPERVLEVIELHYQEAEALLEEINKRLSNSERPITEKSTKP